MYQVYTLGYAAKDAGQRLTSLMQHPRMTLVDIRYRPVSRFHPAFRKPALEQRFGARYVHIPEYGNLNYRDLSKGIVIAQPDQALEKVFDYLRLGRPICLLCACARVDFCHRKVVASLISQELGVSHCSITHY